MKNLYKIVVFLRKIAFMLLVLQGWWCSPLFAQSNSATGGREFYISYLQNYNAAQTIQLKVVVEKSCYITAKYNNQASAYWNNWNNTLVAPGIYTANVSINDVINNPAVDTGGITSRTITLTSTEDVCVYAINYYSASTDGTCILPTPSWGTEYRLATGDPGASHPSLYAVVAKEDNTVVTRHDNTTITLNKNEVYHFKSAYGVDMTGMRVAATKPVALFSGGIISFGPGQSNAFGCSPSIGNASGDHTYEQLWSVDKWGKDFFAFPVRTPNGYGNWGGMLALVAHENGTNITVSGGINGGTPLNYTLNAGGRQYVCYVMSGLTRIVSDKPIMIYLVLPDACVMNIPPTDQRISHALVAPFILSGTTNINSHGIDLLVPAAYWDQTVIKHDGVVVSNSLYTVNSSAQFPGWYHIRRNLANEDIAIDITCPGGFLAYMSGSGSAETYAFAAGAGAYDLQNYFTIQEKGTTIDTYYENTTAITHTFEATDNLVVKRTVESPFTSISWLINSVPYSITENTNAMNTLNFPASVLEPGENFLTMSVRYLGASADSLYTGSVWLEIPLPVIAAEDDFAVTPVNQPVTIPVLNNDQLGSCNSGTISLIVTTPPHSGTISVSAGQIVYTPQSGFHGLDSLKYSINCAGDVSSAWAYIYTYPNSTWLCAGSSANINPGSSSHGVSVAWYNGAAEVTSIPVSNISGTVNYPYEAQVTFPAYLGSVLVTDASSGYHAYVVPLLMYWNKTALDGNWNNPANWTNASGVVQNAVPQSCTTVHIQGNADCYPSLDIVNTPRTVYFDEPECDDIYFHFGGEVAKPHLLNYSKAFVEYNFGYYNGSTYKTDGDSYSATPLKRGQWYALATPLNKIAPGDFSFGGKPDTWQQAFIRNNTAGVFAGQWEDPHNANATDIPAAQYGGIAIWMANVVPGIVGEDASYHTNLNALNGVIRMPYFEDGATSNLHRIHEYTGGESRFYYYYNLDPAQTITTQYSAITRGGDGYRFVFDGNLQPETIDGTVYPTYRLTVPAGKELMIGNPFLSNLDFDMFWEINQNNLENKTYRLYVENNWGHQYTVGSGGTGSPALTGCIAPLQAFFIQTKGTGNVDLLFPPDLVSVTVPANKLRAARGENVYDNVLYVEASNHAGSSWATLGMKEGVNVDQLFNNDELYLNTPQIYFLDGNHKNAVQFMPGEMDAKIPLSIRSQVEGKITLRFANTEYVHTGSLVLIDKVSGDMYDLLQGASEIQFDNVSDFPDRFLLMSDMNPQDDDPQLQGLWEITQVTIGKNTDGDIKTSGYNTATEVKSYIPSFRELEIIDTATLILRYPDGTEETAKYALDGGQLVIYAEDATLFYQYNINAGSTLILTAAYNYVNNLPSGYTERIGEKWAVILTKQK